nr:hypothetical protein [Marinicella sp. W31]MDC2877937.1 hypothetical protein [Marinicella sp. W31]
MRKAPIRNLLLAGSFLAATSAPAFALDAEDMLAKLNAASRAQGSVTFTYDDVKEGADGNLTVSGVVYSPEADNPEALGGLEQAGPMTLDFEGVTENGDGSYSIDKISAADMVFTGEDVEVNIGSLIQGDIEVPATPDTSTLAGWSYAGNTEASDITVTTEGHQVLTIASATGTQTFNDDTSKASFLGTVSGITLDLSGFDDMEDDFREALTALDLMETHSSGTFSGVWDAQSGDFQISTYEIAVEDVGTLSINFAMTGLTLETIETLQKLSAEMPDSGDISESDDANATANAESPYQKYLLELGQKIGLSEFRVNFADASITTRALQYAAEKEGLIAEEMADKIEVDLGSNLTAMNVPGLADMVTTAVGTYFADPQTFTISIKPQMQMPILAVIMAGAAAPQSIPQLLNLQVTANE